MIHRVQTVDDSRLSLYRTLTHSHGRSEEPWFIVEGRWMAQRLLSSPLTVHSLLVEERSLRQFEPLLPPHVPVYVAAEDVIRRIVGYNFHRGVLACGRRPATRSLRELAESLSETDTIVICPNVANPENLGVILRSSAALGVRSILLGPHAADAYTRRVLRVSMGTAFGLEIYRTSELEQDLQRLRAEWQLEIVASVLDATAERLEDVRYRQPRLGLMFGAECDGLKRGCIDLADRWVTIPMARDIDSLNVASAAAIFLHHFTRLARLPEPSGVSCRGEFG